MRTAADTGSASGHPTRVLVVDGYRIFARLLRDALDREPDLLCVGATEGTATAVLEALRLHPDVVLVVGLHLEADDWSAAVVALAAACPSGRIVLLVSTAAEHVLQRVPGTHVCVVLADDTDLAALLEAVRGDPRSVDPAVTMAARVDGPDSPDVPATLLAPADLALLRLVAAGYDSESAARELRISPGFVRHRLRRICADLEADTPAQAVAIAVASRALTLHPEG